MASTGKSMIGGLKIARIMIGQGVTIGRPISADLVTFDQGAVGALASSLVVSMLSGVPLQQH